MKSDKNGSIFDDILGLGKGDDKEAASENDKPANQAQANQEDERDKKIKELEDQLKKTQEFNEKINSQLEQARSTSESLDKIKGIFTGEDSERKNFMGEVKDRENFIADPYGYTQRKVADVEKKLEEKYQKMLGEHVSPIQTDMMLQRAKNEIRKKYVINFDDPSVDKKLGEKIEMINPDYRRKDPVKSILLAAHLAGVIEGKADDIPFIEDSQGFGRARMNKNRVESEIASIKKGIKDIEQPSYIT